MMRNAIRTGRNRTGADMSPIDKKLVIEGAESSIPSMDGDDSAIDQVRAEYIIEDEPIGSLPPPVTLKGVAGTVIGKVKGADLPVFIDKLGERLAFERTGTRLYAALLGKFDASAPVDGGPTREDLEKIHAEELEHFLLLREAMISLGADPTAITPSADVVAVSSMGLLQVLGDPRMNFEQSLEAMLVAELVDNDGWTMLVDLARAVGQEDLAERFESALVQEGEHLANVRGWVRTATIFEAGGQLVADDLEVQ